MLKKVGLGPCLCIHHCELLGRICGLRGHVKKGDFRTLEFGSKEEGIRVVSKQLEVRVFDFTDFSFLTEEIHKSFLPTLEEEVHPEVRAVIERRNRFLSRLITSKILQKEEIDPWLQAGPSAVQ